MKSNKFITNSVVAITSTGVLLSSCDGYFINYEVVDETKLPQIGEHAIEIPLSTKDQEYLRFLYKLGNEIFNNPQVANKFAENPAAYLSKYGYEGDVDLDENMMRMILALGDEQINEAIRNNDIAEVVILMEQKGLLNNTYTNLSLTEEQIEQINEQIGLDKESRTNFADDRYEAVFIALAALYAVALFISQAVALYNAAIGINIAAGVNLIASSNVKVSSAKQINQMSNVIEKNYVLKILDFKGITNGTYIAADKYINDEVKQISKLLKDKHPKSVEGMSETELENYLKAILIKY